MAKKRYSSFLLIAARTRRSANPGCRLRYESHFRDSSYELSFTGEAPQLILASEPWAALLGIFSFETDPLFGPVPSLWVYFSFIRPPRLTAD